jgi:signal transduction histidine kinase
MTDDQKDMIQIMSRASDVVLAVVNDILDAAKLEAQKIKLVSRTFDLFDLVEKTIELFGEKAGTKQIELILSCEPNNLPKYVKSDPER